MPLQSLRAATTLLFAALAAVAYANGEATCEDGTQGAVRASAMLQVRAEPEKTVSALAPDAGNVHQAVQCTPANLEEIHLQESRECLPAGLQELHLKAVRSHAAFLAGQHTRRVGSKQIPGMPPSLEDMTLTTTAVPTTTVPAKDSFTKTKGGNEPSYCDNAYSPMPKMHFEADSAEECATICLADAQCVHFMFHKGTVTYKCRISYTCGVEIPYTKSKSNIDGYMLNGHRTTPTTTGAPTTKAPTDAPAATDETPAATDPPAAAVGDEDGDAPAGTVNGEGGDSAASPGGAAPGAASPGGAAPVGTVNGEGGDSAAAPGGAADAGAAPAGVNGASVALDAAGFKSATALCCPQEMEVFFNRLLDKMGYDGCSVPHIQGLMHWFTCVPDMDLEYMVQVIENGNPCKYWTKKGEECPVLSPQCMGKFCR